MGDPEGNLVGGTVAGEEEDAVCGFAGAGGAAEGGLGGGWEEGEEESNDQFHQSIYRLMLEHTLDKMFESFI
jgi:hypothetical protein